MLLRSKLEKCPGLSMNVLCVAPRFGRTTSSESALQVLNNLGFPPSTPLLRPVLVLLGSNFASPCTMQIFGVRDLRDVSPKWVLRLQAGRFAASQCGGLVFHFLFQYPKTAPI